LLAAEALLRSISPSTTNDPETLGSWGAVHKRLWDLDEDPTALDESIVAYSQGFQLKQDDRNGINCVTLLKKRALLHAFSKDLAPNNFP
jgi:hypothetical protein